MIFSYVGTVDVALARGVQAVLVRPGGVKKGFGYIFDVNLSLRIVIEIELAHSQC